MVEVRNSIPILDEEMLRYTAVSDEDIFANVVDYSEAAPQGTGEPLGRVSYAAKAGKLRWGIGLFQPLPFPVI